MAQLLLADVLVLSTLAVGSRSAPVLAPMELTPLAVGTVVPEGWLRRQLGLNSVHTHNCSVFRTAPFTHCMLF